MFCFFVVVIIAAFVVTTTIGFQRPFIDPVATLSLRTSDGVESVSSYKWSELWYSGMPIDHFSFTDKRTFDLRYLLNNDNFKSGGPIFFYTGNEGGIEGFAQNTGFMWDLAPQFGALLIFAEHRYYGKTQPFGNESYASVANLGYLTSEQALADYAILIEYLKSNITGAEHSPVVVFGGSYGGMLAAWFRLKYPHLAVGAIAASAPVFQFLHTNVDQGVYDKIVTRSFVNSGCNIETVTNAFVAMKKLGTTDDGRFYLNQVFNLDPKSILKTDDDISFLLSFIREAFESMAMVNYPYETNFLMPLPAWPVKVACSYLNETMHSEEQFVNGLYQLVNLYYNYTGNVAKFCANAAVCGDSAYSALGSPLGWPWQTCTEMVMPLCGKGQPNDFFWNDCPFTIDGAYQSCDSTFGNIGYDREFLRPDWALTNYGREFRAVGNIIFSNGYLDPWSGGGYSLKPRTDGSLVSIIIEDGAHHYDLRAANPLDTPAVINARQLETMYITKWIDDAKRIVDKQARKVASKQLKSIKKALKKYRLQVESQMKTDEQAE